MVKKGSILLMCMIALVAFAIWAPNAAAWEQWSTDRNTTNCAGCHGNFRAAGYISASDGTAWNANLHDPHRNTWLAGECAVCHQPPTGTPRFPVFLNISAGIPGLAPLSCTGCHEGEGLRAHHINAGAVVIGDPEFCSDCHADPNPPGEDVNPPYYGDTLGQIPSDACNTGAPPRNENKFGAFGLDNDGDLLYDGDDPDCAVAEPDINLNPAALDFGVVTIGNSSTLSADIENLGNAELTVTSITLAAGTSAEFTFTDPTPIIIPPGGSQAVTVTYTPVDVGLDTGGLDIASDDPDEPTVTLALSGTGEAAPTPDINLNPAALDFGTVFTGNASTLNANIENLGNAELTVTLIDLCVGTSTEFSFTADPTPIVIPPGVGDLHAGGCGRGRWLLRHLERRSRRAGGAARPAGHRSRRADPGHQSESGGAGLWGGDHR